MTDQPDWAEIHIGLCATFPEDEIKQRPGRGGQSYDYIDARAVMDRLDEVVGPDNWEARFHPLPDSETSKAVECTLTIYGISKADVGYPNSAQDAGNDANEPWKASYSDALKRAAVHWGVGRFLYGGTAKQHGKPAGRATPKPEPRGPYPAGEAAQAMEANPAAAVHAERIKSAGKPSPGDPASANDLATIAKLSRLLGEPEGISDGMTSADAKERIRHLSASYNEKQGPARKTGEPSRQAQETRI